MFRTPSSVNPLRATSVSHILQGGIRQVADLSLAQEADSLLERKIGQMANARIAQMANVAGCTVRYNDSWIAACQAMLGGKNCSVSMPSIHSQFF
jgi:hypothetical protein